MQLIGAAFICIGTWAYIEKNDHDYGQPKENSFDLFDLLFDLTVLMIALGTIIFILAFCGCLGALRENIFLLKFVSILDYIIMYSKLDLHPARDV